MDHEMWIPITMFLVIGVSIVATLYFRYRTRSQVQATIRLALEKGNQLTPELLERMAEAKQTSTSDLRKGLIAVGLGIAFALFGYILGEEDAVRPLVGTGMFPLLVGVAYLIMWRLSDKGARS
ncbi:MAG: DUF6249 domain-containing protein [Gammaproteobacteria bacterium]|nr:DUF6249 domain-containing protein [Gammaproteobacteria bacterium]MDH4253943.1 DUF6249 domain-containing protein [Gammaproteobacteria bacterium]MDH5310578.1 DUF6249 domain-containing protein [Gammaproteobacteria bacterium]